MGTVHVVLAITCLVLGAMVFLQKKGGQKHRLLGYLYSSALLLVNLSALTVYQDAAGPGPFHYLALISLATLSAGFITAFLRKPAQWMSMHAYFMSWSYVGLVAAGIAQIITEFLPFSTAFTVALPSAVIIAVGAIMIHLRTPRIIATLSPLNFTKNSRERI